MGDTDELVGGSRRDPLRVPRWLAVTAGVLTAAGIAYVAVSSEGDPTPPGAAGRPSSPSAIPGTPTTNTSAQALTGPLTLTGVTCVTTRPRDFTVHFGVQNIGIARVTVLSVSANLPIGGLSPTGARVPATRTCGGAAFDPSTSLVLEPGDRLPVSLTFASPASCPAPYPVQADVALLGSHEMPGTQTIAVLADLGGYQDLFPTCSA